jgi:hypothetical protein
MIHENIDRIPSQMDSEAITDDSGVQYNMGKSEKFAVHIPTFLRRNEGDPAIKVNIFLFCPPKLTYIPPLQNFFSKLREHLLPRVQAEHQREAESLPRRPGIGTVSDYIDGNDSEMTDSVFLRNDCIYHHQLLRFHYTTYDVQRGTDVVNAGTSRCNVMLLTDNADGSSRSHHFLYARILGAYHANVIYAGPGMQDSQARRLDFLWVRWFEVVDPASSAWPGSNSTLDLVRFPPMNQNSSFGFVDPRDVLHGCHILPAFAKGKRQANGVSISRCAKDGKDYNLYYIGRYVQAMLKIIFYTDS